MLFVSRLDVCLSWDHAGPLMLKFGLDEIFAELS